MMKIPGTNNTPMGAVVLIKVDDAGLDEVHSIFYADMRDCLERHLEWGDVWNEVTAYVPLERIFQLYNDDDVLPETKDEKEIVRLIGAAEAAVLTLECPSCSVVEI